MSTHEEIYNLQAEKYEQLISKQADFSEVIKEIRHYRDLDIVDLGAGSGRLTTLLAREAHTIISTDRSAAMLQLLERKMQEVPSPKARLSTVVCDHRKLPLADHSADLIVSGWSICYLTNTEISNWREHIAIIVSEMERLLRSDGTIIIFETLGTGTEQPNPPSFLTPYYRVLEEEYGFLHKSIRTDYTFSDVEEAKQLTRFFFGEGLAQQVVTNNWSTVPECAGIWWKQL